MLVVFISLIIRSKYYYLQNPKDEAGEEIKPEGDIGWTGGNVL